MMQRVALARWGNYTRHDALIRFAQDTTARTRVRLYTPKRICLDSFQMWRKIADRRIELKAAERRVVRRRHSKALRKCFGVWRSFLANVGCQRRRARRRDGEHVCLCSFLFFLACCFPTLFLSCICVANAQQRWGSFL